MLDLEYELGITWHCVNLLKKYPITVLNNQPNVDDIKVLICHAWNILMLNQLTMDELYDNPQDNNYEMDDEKMDLGNDEHDDCL